MIVGRMAKYARPLMVLIVIVVGSLALGMSVEPAGVSGVPDTPAIEADSGPSVTCTPFGLYGDITSRPLVGRLSDSSDNLTFVGTTNGLHVVASGGKLQHFLYSPFGIKHTALIDDITGDGLREVVVALNDTQAPALRCYDGATWEKVWQYAPMTRIWDKLWVDRQMIITDLEVVDDGDSQRVVISSGRCVLSIGARDGTEQWRFTAEVAVWRMVTLPDLNNDGAEEVFAGSDDGHLFWLNARTGKAQWQTKLSQHEGVNYNGINHLVSDIAVLDEEASKVAVSSGDGWVQKYDLAKKKREWDTRVFKVDQEESSPLSESTNVYISPVADFTEDGLPEILLTKTPFTNSYLPGSTNGEVALCDSSGSIVWHKGTPERGTSVPLGMAFETSVFEGKPVYLDGTMTPITLVDVRDGESVLHTVPVDALNGPAVIVMQPGGNGYLSFSSTSDLAAISAKGELLWYYPRIGKVMAVNGNFVGDGTEDILLCAESGGVSYSPSSQAAVRLLRMMDRATGDTVWSYELPYGKLKMGGGLKGARLTANLVGSDNIQDIVGYCEDEVCIFSGRDGAASTIKTGQTMTSLDAISNGASGSALAVGNADGLMVFGGSGAPLWTTTTAEWLGEGRGSFAALDDINADNVSDLAIASDTRIVVLKSNGSASDYRLHQTIQAEEGSSIKLPAMVADSDRDGIRELAYFQEKQPQQSEHMSFSACHMLCIQSLEDGNCLFKTDLQGTAYAHDLSCGDFNGDGCPDSALLVAWRESNTMGQEMRVVSGKDGSLLWKRSYDTGGYGYSGIGRNELPAMNIGDINGDGADDLACNVGYDWNESWAYRRQRLQVFDVTQDTILKDIALAPRFQQSSFGDSYDTGSDEAMLLADVDNDGRREVLMKVAEPSERSYDRNYYPYRSESSSPRYLAVVDMDTGWRLATFKGFETETMSLFRSHQPGILGLAACGGVCYLRIGSDLEVTSPEDGARTEPIVGVQWLGSTDGDFSQVFVDGVRNNITSGCESELFLARGNHAIVVRSTDEYGRISYSPSDMSAPLAIKVTPSPWKPVWLVLSLSVLLAMVLLLFYARLQRTWRARKRAAK